MYPDEQTIGEANIHEIIDRTIRKTNVILDATILTILMACPRLADFRFNHNLISIGGKSNSLECGSIVHTFMEYFYRAIIQGVKRDKAVQIGMGAAELYIKGCPHCTDFVPTMEQMKPTCGHKVNEFPGAKNTPKEPDKNNPREKFKTGWRHVLDTCDEYQRFYRNDHWVPLEVEVVKGEVLYEDDEIRIMWKSKLDWIVDTNQGVYPVDHKSMKARRDNLTLNNQFIGQCIMTKTRGMFINKVGFQTSLKPEEKFIRSMVSYSAPRLMEWQSEILPYYGKLFLMYAESGHFPPNYTHCEHKYGNCNFHSVCEADPSGREDEIKKLFIVGPEWNPTNDEDEAE